jgi:shikimate kinase
MMRIFLTGYMGAGKTTLGKAFAREMNVPFIDLDWYIEERFHKSIRELFTERGEASFRELERNMLHEVGEFEDVVVSTGGGTPCFFDNMEYMNGCGQTVFLDVHPDILFRIHVGERILVGEIDSRDRWIMTEPRKAPRDETMIPLASAGTAEQP